MSSAMRRMRNPNELFVGDLSFFCNESHLEALFSPFGTVVEARVKRSDKGNRTLLYGFVRMESLKSALDASKALNGVSLLGRNIRVQLSLTNSQNDAPVKPKDGAQIQVNFHSSFPTDGIVEPNESFLRVALEKFGEIRDVVVKDYVQHQDEQKQEGYAFVMFASQDNADNALANGCNLDCQGVQLQCTIVAKSLKPNAEKDKLITSEPASNVFDSKEMLNGKLPLSLTHIDTSLNLNPLLAQDSHSGRWSLGTADSCSSIDSFPLSGYSGSDLSPMTQSPKSMQHKQLGPSFGRLNEVLFSRDEPRQQLQQQKWYTNPLSQQMAINNDHFIGHSHRSAPQLLPQQVRSNGYHQDGAFRRSDWIRQQQQLHLQSMEQSSQYARFAATDRQSDYRQVQRSQQRFSNSRDGNSLSFANNQHFSDGFQGNADFRAQSNGHDWIRPNTSCSQPTFHHSQVNNNNSSQMLKHSMRSEPFQGQQFANYYDHSVEQEKLFRQQQASLSRENGSFLSSDANYFNQQRSFEEARNLPSNPREMCSDVTALNSWNQPTSLFRSNGPRQNRDYNLFQGLDSTPLSLFSFDSLRKESDFAPGEPVTGLSSRDTLMF